MAETVQGWFWYDMEYASEGFCGPFDSEAEARQHAAASETPTEYVGVVSLPYYVR